MVQKNGLGGSQKWTKRTQEYLITEYGFNSVMINHKEEPKCGSVFDSLQKQSAQIFLYKY